MLRSTVHPSTSEILSTPGYIRMKIIRMEIKKNVELTGRKKKSGRKQKED